MIVKILKEAALLEVRNNQLSVDDYLIVSDILNKITKEDVKMIVENILEDQLIEGTISVDEFDSLLDELDEDCEVDEQMLANAGQAIRNFAPKVMGAAGRASNYVQKGMRTIGGKMGGNLGRTVAGYAGKVGGVIKNAGLRAGGIMGKA